MLVEVRIGVSVDGVCQTPQLARTFGRLLPKEFDTIKRLEQGGARQMLVVSRLQDGLHVSEVDAGHGLS